MENDHFQFESKKQPDLEKQRLRTPSFVSVPKFGMENRRQEVWKIDL